MDPKRQLPKELTSVNEEFFDALIRHQIYLLRYSGEVRNKINALLNASERDIARLIKDKALQGLTTKRLESLLKQIKTTRLKSWKDINELWLTELAELSKQEVVTTAGIVRTVAPVVLTDLALPAPELLRAIATSNPFEGRTLKEWASSIQATDLRRIEDQIKIGLVQGENPTAIARRVVGTASLKGSDGITQITRNNASAITRTAINHITNAARREFYKINPEIFSKELYVATLDARTTAICRSLDGKVYGIGVGPLPPLHFNCRSLRVAIIDGNILGSRPNKPFTQKQFLREYTTKNKLDLVTKRADLPRGHKTSFDTFSSQRIRELTGTIPAKVTYQEWLTRQSVGFQEDVLGKTKATLFRKGNLTLDKFVNRKGDELTLEQLAKKHTEAFIAAGLDPKNF